MLGGIWVIHGHHIQAAGRVTGCEGDPPAFPVVVLAVEGMTPADRFFPVVLAVRDAVVADDRKSGGGCALAAGWRLRLSWPAGGVMPVPGEHWEINARVRRPAGMANPGGFDYERWLFSEGIAGTGYVRSARRLHAAGLYPGQAIRTAIRDFLWARGPASTVPEAPDSHRWQHGGVLLALALADGSAVTAAEWQLFRDTGTIHMIIVSGLHIVIVAFLGAVPGWLLGRGLLCLYPGFTVRFLPYLSGLVAAAGYAALTGYEVPALRAVFLFAIGSGTLLLARRLPPATVFGVVLLVTATCAPLSLLASGFWLSFVAVAVLIGTHAGSWRAPQRLSAMRTFARSQIMLTIGLLGWVAGLVGSVSVTGPLVNLLVVPLVSVVVLPFLLAGCALVPLGGGLPDLLVQVADSAMTAVMVLLELAARPRAMLVAVHGLPIMTVAVIAAFLAVLPLPRSARVLVLPLALLPLLPAWPRPAPGEFEVAVLDVGQGSAALISTRHNLVVMDAGPRFASGFDTGEAVVLPMIASTPLRQPQVMIVTHADIDHAGGAGAIAARHPDLIRLGSEGLSGETDCHAFPGWRSDGVSFRLLSDPVLQKLGNGNDRSCTLLVDNGRTAALLTGDTGAAHEMALLRGLSEDVLGRLGIVLVPHHGSRSSSSRAFVRRTRPEYALVSAGRNNRYGHPHPEVVERWQQAGARVLVTSRGGALFWSSADPGRVRSFRADAARYWRSPAST